VLCDRFQFAHHFGKTEVGQLDSTVTGKNNVCWFYVTMNQVRGVCFFEAVAEVEQYSKTDIEGNAWLGLEQFLNGHTVVILHYDVIGSAGLAIIHDINNIVVLDPGCRVGFALESFDVNCILGQVWKQHLDRDRHIQRHFACLVDGRHSAHRYLL